MKESALGLMNSPAAALPKWENPSSVKYFERKGTEFLEKPAALLTLTPDNFSVLKMRRAQTSVTYLRNPWASLVSD